MSTITGIILGVTAVVGAGASVYSAAASAEAQEQAAAYNAAVQRNNAIRQRYQVEQQAAQDRAIAENQVAYQKYNAQIQRNNAITLANQAKAVDDAARENIRRERDRKRRVLGGIRASAASQGLNVGEGTVVESLSDTSGIIELDILNVSRQAEREMNALMYEAQLAEAGISRTNSEAAITQIRADNADYNFSTGRYIEMFGKQQSEFTLLQGRNAAASTRLSGYASAANSLGSAYGTYADYQNIGLTGGRENSYFGTGQIVTT